MKLSLSQQIEQADASEFVDYALKLLKLVKPSPDPFVEEEEFEEYHTVFLPVFTSHLKYQSGHIAAAIMLADATQYMLCIEAYEESDFDESGFKYGYTVDLYNSDDIWSAEHSIRQMAVICAIAKKLESE